MLWYTAICIAENASVTGNFAHKKEAYAKRQNDGVALPQKKAYWTYHMPDISFGQIKEDLLGNYNIILL